MSSEVAARMTLGRVSHGRVRENADLLLNALEVRPGDRCLSIASAGDNALALLLADPAEVTAVDLNPAQIACLALRVAAYRALDHEAFLEFYGVRPSRRRAALYARCRPLISDSAVTAFWDERNSALHAHGFSGIGRLERCFRLFRGLLRNLMHGRDRVAGLLEAKDRAERDRFFRKKWNSWRWRLLFRAFFCRKTMQALGRDPAFFIYAETDLPRQLLMRSRHALVNLDPGENPYLQHILTGRYGKNLPLALRPESFEIIRARLDRLHYRTRSLEEAAIGRFERMNLSGIFEYMSEAAFQVSLTRLRKACTPGSRAAFWNLLVARETCDAGAWRSISDPKRGWLLEDKALFYSAFHVLKAV